MHRSTFKVMRHFTTTYLNPEDSLSILDVGSMDVNGSYKPLFNNPLWYYTGLDIEQGPNVDVVIQNPYKWDLEFQYDVVVSGQCLEHTEAPWLWAKEVEKYCKPNGLICIIAPWSWHIHKHPVDCWRILPDGIDYLFTKHCNFTKLLSGSNRTDCYFMGKKNI